METDRPEEAQAGRRPRIVLTVLVRDEIDIVADMLHWHLAQGVDHVVAMDNGSTDGTTEVLEDLAASGALTLIRQPSDAYLQDVWTMQMAGIARDRHAADWIIPTDADEFWMPPDGLDLAGALAGHGSEVDMVRCPRRNLMASREALETAAWHEALVWRADPPVRLTPARRVDPAPLEPPLVYYDLPSKVVLNPARLRAIDRGAHNARFDGAPGTRPVEQPGGGLTIYHAPFRDRAEFLLSTARIADAVDRDPRARPDTSWKSRRWRRMAPEDAFAEALPDHARLHRDIAAGRVRRDTRLRDAVTGLRARTAPALALYGATRGGGRTRAPGPLLVLGMDAGEVAAVASRLRAMGGPEARLLGEVAFGGAFGAMDLAGLLPIGSEEPLHRAVIAPPDRTGADGCGPCVILLARGGRHDRPPADGAPALLRAEAATRALPRLLVSPERLLAAPAEALGSAVAALEDARAV